jgi:hypothetical protein
VTIPQPKGAISTLILFLVIFGLSILNVCLRKDTTSALAMMLGILIGIGIACALSALLDKINPRYNIRMITSGKRGLLIQAEELVVVRGSKSAEDAALSLFNAKLQILKQQGFKPLSDLKTAGDDMCSCLFRSFETADGEQATITVIVDLVD